MRLSLFAGLAALALLAACGGGEDAETDGDAGGVVESPSADDGTERSTSTVTSAPPTDSDVGANTDDVGEPAAGDNEAGAEGEDTGASDDATGTPSTETTTPRPSTGTDGGDDPAPSAAGEGTVLVRLEAVRGRFIEGFEAAIRIETTTGEVVAATLWSDYVADLGGTVDPYRAVYQATVPAGDVVVMATANVGAGPPPVVPDIGGSLDCEVEVTVPADGQVEVELAFTGRPGCLTIIG